MSLISSHKIDKHQVNNSKINWFMNPCNSVLRYKNPTNVTHNDERYSSKQTMVHIMKEIFIKTNNVTHHDRDIH